MKRLTGVGVGPGDPELITVKAVRVLRGADVLVPVLAAGDGARLGLPGELIAPADIVIWASSPVHPVVLGHARAYAEVAETATILTDHPKIVGQNLRHSGSNDPRSRQTRPRPATQEPAAIGVVAVTKAGRQAARTLTTQWPDARAYDGPAAQAVIHRPLTLLVGMGALTRDATRPGQAASLTALRDFDPARVDMHTPVMVGSSRTRVHAGRMVTPRDYRWASQGQESTSEVVP